MKTVDLARGKWRGILLSLGVDEKFLNPKHGPCPFCEGTDRYRWDNKGGSGSFICNQCGAGDGIELLKRWHGWDFRKTAQEVDRIVSGVSPEKQKPEQSAEQRRDMLRRLWSSSRAIAEGDLAWKYLTARNVLPKALPLSLRFAERCPIPGGGQSPAMLALVEDSDGVAVTIHRTFLGPDGKADIANPRALMPGTIPEGSAVRLYAIHGERLGIAEGIETAIAAAKRFKVPTWAALNANLLSKWTPPAGVSEVLIFGDCDAKFGGQAAAYALAHRLSARMGIAATVHIPEVVGRDWADEDAA